MSNVNNLEILRKSLTIAESQAKIKFDLTEHDELNNQEAEKGTFLCSNKIHIPEINGFWWELRHN